VIPIPVTTTLRSALRDVVYVAVATEVGTDDVRETNAFVTAGDTANRQKADWNFILIFF